MTICPECGADGAIVTHVSAYKGVLLDEVYCDICQQTSTIPKRIKKGHNMKVSYKGVTGKLLKMELEKHKLLDPVYEKEFYTLLIEDESDGHKHVFENVDLSDVKFIGATVMLV